MKGFALGLALKQRRNATRKSPIILAPLQIRLDQIIFNLFLSPLRYQKQEMTSLHTLLYMFLGRETVVPRKHSMLIIRSNWCKSPLQGATYCSQVGKFKLIYFQMLVLVLALVINRTKLFKHDKANAGLGLILVLLSYYQWTKLFCSKKGCRNYFN